MLEHKFERCTQCEGEGIERFDDVFVDCSKCSGRGEIEIPIGEDEIVYVNVYSVTREYGGPEEGGWWYNDLNCIEVIPVKNKYSDLMKEQAIQDNKKLKHGNIYSVLGGRDIEVLVESEPQQSETREKPHYE